MQPSLVSNVNFWQRRSLPAVSLNSDFQTPEPDTRGTVLKHRQKGVVARSLFTGFWEPPEPSGLKVAFPYRLGAGTKVRQVADTSLELAACRKRSRIPHSHSKPPLLGIENPDLIGGQSEGIKNKMPNKQKNNK